MDTNRSTNISAFLSNKITHSSVVFTLMVVFIHYSASCNLFENSNIWDRIIDYLGQGITRNAVPCFFLISGMLLFWKVDRESNSCLIKGAQKRIFSLGVPYLIWNLIATIFYFVLDKITKTGDFKFSFIFLLDCIFNQKYNGPLWYVQYLLVFSVCSPLLYYIIRRKNIYAITIALLLGLWFFYPNALGLIYFCLGAGLAFHKKELLNSHVNKKTLLVYILFFLLLQLYRLGIYNASLEFVEARKQLSYRGYELLSPITLWFALDIIPFDKIRTHSFEKHTFIVYASHYMVVSLATTSIVENILRLPTNNPIYAFVMFVLIPLSIFWGGVLLSILLKKIAPQLHRILVGGR